MASKERMLCCLRPKVAAAVGSGLLAIGITCLVVGGLLPGLTETALEDSIVENSVLKPGNDATESYLEVLRAKEFGGNDSLSDDSARNMVAHVSNITNLEAVLMFGAAPVIQDVTYTFKRYAYTRQLEFSADGSIVSFHSQRVDVPSPETLRRWETEVLATPSLPWATLRNTVKDLGLIAQRFGDNTLTERPHNDVEDLLVPVLAAGALNTGLPTLKAVLRNVVTGAYWPTVVKGALGGGLTRTQLASAILSGSPSSFAGPLSSLAHLAANYTLLASAIPGFDQTQHTPSVSQFTTLALNTSALSAAGAGAQTFAGMLPVSPTTPFAAMQVNTAFIGITSGLAAAMPSVYAVGGSAANGPNDLAKMHTAFTAFYLWFLTGPSAPAPAQAAFDSTLTSIYTAASCQVGPSGSPTGSGADLGGSAALSAPAGFDEVFGLQFGSGAAVAALGFFGTIGSNCSSVSAGAANTAMSTSSINLTPGCAAGTSLFDIVNNPSLLPGSPEVSCVTNRAIGALDAQIANTFTGSRFGAATGAFIVDKLQTGRGLLGAVAQLALGTTLPAGSEFIAKAMNTAWFVKHGHASITNTTQALAAQLSITTSGAGAVASAAARTEFQRLYQQSLTMHASVHAECGTNATARGLPAGLNCFEVLDLASYFTSVARQWAYFPQLVWNYPVPGNNANKQGVHMSNVATGPFARTTAKDFLGSGYHESLLWFLANRASGTKAPPAVMALEQSEAAYLAGRTNATKDAFYTGATDLSRIGETVRFSGRDSYEEWVFPGKPGVPVKGAYDSTRFEPSFDLRFEPEDANATIGIWLGELRRTVTLAFNGEVDGPNGDLAAFRYKLMNEEQLNATGLPGQKPVTPSDVDGLRGQPKCLYSVQRIQNPTSASNPDVYLSAPEFSLCDAADKAMYQAPAGIDTDSYAAEKYSTVVDVEPVSGRTINAVRRLAVYLRMQPSAWYPNLPAGQNFYQPIYWLQESRGINAEDESDLADALDRATALQFALSPALLAIGIVSTIAGGYFALIAFSILCGTKPTTARTVKTSESDAAAEEVEKTTEMPAVAAASA